MLAAYLSSALIVQAQGESAGAYGHYFSQFVNFPDLLYATLRVSIFIVVIIVIHCYKGLLRRRRARTSVSRRGGQFAPASSSSSRSTCSSPQSSGASTPSSCSGVTTDARLSRSGMAAERSTYIRRALFALVGLVVVVVLASLVSSLRPDNTFRLRMYTDTLAGGIGEGTGVVVNGAEIGTVRTITPTRTGEFVVDLAMDPDRLKTPGIISTTTRLTYAPKNLFGIAAVVLDSVPGGEPIASGETSIRIPPPMRR